MGCEASRRFVVENDVRTIEDARRARKRATGIFADERRVNCAPVAFFMGRTARWTLGGARGTPVARVEGARW